jgi:hypothetical protein
MGREVDGVIRAIVKTMDGERLRRIRQQFGDD